jgi:hypothetical protein
VKGIFKFIVLEKEINCDVVVAPHEASFSTHNTYNFFHWEKNPGKPYTVRTAKQNTQTPVLLSKIDLNIFELHLK